MYISHLECPKCNATYESERAVHLCRCGSPLLVRYDLKKVKRTYRRRALASRRESLWRYRELLPIHREENIVSLGEGMTPLLYLKKSGSKLGFNHLYLKDESLIPTGTFKARGAAVGVSRAKELGIKVLAMPTNGNAGGSWAAYSAKAGIRAIIVMPQDAPVINRKEVAIAGADLYLVNGLISDAGKIVGRAIADYGWYDASTLKEPYRIEGKKTMGLEIVEQLDWEVPDVIVYPTGGGVGMIGIFKALRELQEIGWIGEKMPRLVSVQSTGCAPVVKAWEERRSESAFWKNSRTIAFGLNVPKALGDFLILQAIYETNGCAVAVEDDEILRAQRMLASEEGIFCCPEGAATLSAAMRLIKSNWIKPNEKVVLLNTGTGLKYPDIVPTEPPLLQPEDQLPGI
ncbi:MAG: threonine synthase [Thermodesulfobacteriota bacterium]